MYKILSAGFSSLGVVTQALWVTDREKAFCRALLLREPEHCKLYAMGWGAERQLKEDLVLKKQKKQGPLGSQQLNTWSPGGLHLET